MIQVQAQQIVQRLDTKDGLPDRHVYGCITDRLGYLWLATPKGVVRYNGYNATVFGTGEGLPTDDNWRLLEDSSGRIWLGNISYEIGYLKNDHYHCAARFDNIVYPSSMVRLGGGIALLSREYYLSNPTRSCEYIVCDGRRTRCTSFPLLSSYRMLLNGSGNMIVYEGAEFLSYRRINAQGKPGTVAVPLPWQNSMADFAILFRNFHCSIRWGVPFFDIIRVDAKKTMTRRCFLSAANEQVTYAYELDDNCYIISDKKVYVYDSLFRLSVSYTLAELTAGEKTGDRQYCIYNQYPLWGDLLSTSDKGLYRRLQQPFIFKQKALSGLEGCRLAGQADSLGYWWDDERQQLYILNRDSLTARYALAGVRKLQYVETLSGDTILLSSASSNFLFRNGVLLPAYRMNPADSLLIKNCAVAGDKTVVMLHGGAIPQLVQASYTGSRLIGTVPARMICYDRYRHGLWLYHNLGLAFYDIRAGKLQKIPHDTLLSMGIRNVESVVADPVYGNVFVKDMDKIWLLGENRCSVQPVLNKYRHHDARLQVNTGRLIVGGRIGLLCLPLLGKGKFGVPVVYENSKDHYYRMLTDLQVWGNHALLKTDRGFYELDLDAQGLLADTALIVGQLSDTTRSLKDGDTLLLPAGASAMHLDLIRPSGRGQPEFSYTWEDGGAMQNATNNEISFEHLKPYRCYRLYLQPRDEVWNGRVLTMLVQQQPQWWQRYSFLSAMILLGLLLGLFTVLLTRRIVLKKQRAKQQLLELSFDAAYARINPHFIFNTLSLAQHHIKTGKTEAAGRYISRFSRLLRSYLKSVRLRYTSIEEEARLLEDYIVLQQERFDNRFSYRISIAKGVDRSLRIPTLLLQPFVENAIRHGLWNKEGKGHLAIIFNTEEDNLYISIADDGIGRERAAALNRDPASGSYGNELAGKLVQLFNKYEKTGLKIEYRDTVPEGTTVLITLKKKNDENA